MSGTCKQAFTLIELLVAIAIILLMATISVPAYKRLFPNIERNNFLSKLEQLTTFAWNNAVNTNKIHAILFDIKEGQVRIQVDSGKRETIGKIVLQNIKGAHLQTSTAIPKNIEIKNFIIEGFDEASKGRLEQAYFYIMPDGLAQQVTINMVDTAQRIAGRARQIGLVLNPFSARFTIYDQFQK
ncbi:MAG: prepilin-type N-terminal cleavage/methylation domain-containing protein [Candidatus Dependentiae bacterium]|nr:prepilin-type N-terminal cleavage/methylation domain-containing protein [Candidatus Dependentiae bacterium]MCL5875264.1 prepilin-type N-terminal cleavage/methylation domain-containing protein [Candidatus Dependentiae bacterium]